MASTKRIGRDAKTGESIPVKEAERRPGTTDKMTHRIVEAETSGRAQEPLSAARMKRLALGSATFHDQQSLKYGFIDAITLPALPASGVVYITDQYSATLPG
jgi:hypothetical protein